MASRNQRDAWLSYPGCQHLDLAEYLHGLESGELEPGISPGGAAGALGVKRGTVTALARRGHLPPRVVTDDDGELAVVEFTLSAIRAVSARPERSTHDPRQTGRRTTAPA